MLYCFNIHRNTVKAFNKVLHDQLFIKTAMVEILRIAVFPSGIDSVGHVLALPKEYIILYSDFKILQEF